MGKQHGHLTRAGKVRAATPKVEPQEKSKAPVGRAKKRKQAARRSQQGQPNAQPREA